MRELEDNFKQSGGFYKDFRIGDLFSVKSNPQLNKDSFIFSDNGEYPYFTRTCINNGIAGYVEYLDEEHKIKGNSIAVGMLGMQFFYMQKDFYAGQFTKTIYPKFTYPLNARIAHYFIAQFNKKQTILQGVLVRDFEKTFINEKIILPIYSNGEIAFDYMESFIRELEIERFEELKVKKLRELEAYLAASGLKDYKLTDSESLAMVGFKYLQDKYNSISDFYKNINTPLCDESKSTFSTFNNLRWQEFKIDELFTLCQTNKKLSGLDISENGKTPVYSAESCNAGISGYTELTPHFITTSECPVYVVFGDHTRTFNIAKESFCVRDNVKVLIPKYKNIKILLFILSVWSKTIPDLGYARHWKVAKKSLISLPVISNHNDNKFEIAFDYMETFIQALQKEAIKDVVLWNEKELKATKDAINRI